MIRAVSLGFALTLLAATQTQASLTLCNRTSYRVQAAIGLEKRANVATVSYTHLTLPTIYSV